MGKKNQSKNNGDKKKNINTTYKELLNAFYRHNRFNLFMSITGALVLSIAIITSSWVVQQSIDFVMGSNGITFLSLIFMTLIVAVLMLSAGVCVYFFRTKFTAKAVQQYRDKALQMILKKDIADFEENNTYSYLSAMTNDIAMIKENYLDQIPIIVQILICSIGAVLLMLYYNPVLTILALSISLIPTVASLKSGKTLEKADLEVSDENSRYMDRLGDILNGFGVIKTCTASEGMEISINKRNLELKNKILRRERKLEKINYYAAMSGFISQFAVLLVCVYFAVFKKSISAGTIVVFIRLMTYIIDPVTNLPEMISKAGASKKMIEKFARILSWEEKPEPTGQSETMTFSKNIVIENVSYRYGNGEDSVLKNWNMTFEKGKKYIIAGTSGSGKSTLFQLITNTYMPTRGRLLIDDVPLSEVPKHRLYSLCSIVYQKNFIFNDSILNNLTLFREVSEQEIKEAITRAALDEVIEKRGLDYPCGENGENLSGGECQRIAIARSYLCHTPILLLDEATSALDHQTARKVMRNLMLNRNETVIAIMHTLEKEVLERCDLIIVVDKGEIVERGSFDELIRKSGFFNTLYQNESEIIGADCHSLNID